MGSVRFRAAKNAVDQYLPRLSRTRFSLFQQGDEKTLSIYLDPSQPASFGGVDAVYRAVKEKGKKKISPKQVPD